jgi:pyruvate formate lyase activating enzyme
VKGVEAYIAGKPIISTTDWPSKVTCVVFFVGCNLRCRFCFNAPLLEFNDQFKVNLTLLYPEIAANQFLIDGVIVTGGEPTLQRNALKTLAEWTHNQNLEFGLMTNGTKPDVIRQLLDEKLLDYIAVDIKTIPNQEKYVKVTQSSSQILDRIKETVAILKSSKVNHEFRTTLVPTIVDTLQQLDQIRRWVGSQNYVLQNFRPSETVLDSTLTTSFTPNQLDQFQQYAKKHKIKTRF